MDLVTNWCVQVASNHELLFQQQLLKTSISVWAQSLFVQVLHLCSWRGDIYWPTQVSNLSVSQSSENFYHSPLTG